MYKYKTFKSSKEFEEWQDTLYPVPIILQMVPIVKGMSASNIEENSKNMSLDSDIEIFVVYKE